MNKFQIQTHTLLMKKFIKQLLHFKPKYTQITTWSYTIYFRKYPILVSLSGKQKAIGVAYLCCKTRFKPKIGLQGALNCKLTKLAYYLYDKHDIYHIA